MQKLRHHHRVRARRAAPLAVRLEDPPSWLYRAALSAAARWRTSHRDDPPFRLGEDADIVVAVENLLPGLLYRPLLKGRAVAPRLLLSPDLELLSVSARAQVVAQALGAAAGVPFRDAEDDPRPGVMHPRTPAAWQEVTATPAHRDERTELRKRLRLHDLERLRLHEPRTRLAAYEDRRLLEYGPPMSARNSDD